MPLLNWGLLSTARINRAVIPPLRTSQRNRLVAVASRAQDKADAYAREWGIERAYGSYEALLADPEIHVIYNPLPNHLHAEWTLKAAQAGKHVLCEKPLALTTAEVDALIAAARANQVIIAEAFMYLHHPQTIKVKELVTSGALGPVRLAHGTFSFNLNHEQDVRWDPAMGGGAVWDVGCYPLSYLRYLLGEPEEVFGWQTLGPSGVDVIFTAQLRFPNAVLAQFDCGFRAQYRTHFEVVGEQGALAVPVPFRPGIDEQLRLTRGEQTEMITLSGEPLYVGEVENIADAILSGAPSRVSLAFSRGNIHVIQCLLQSAREGRPIVCAQS